jgi:polyhydroxyalkanoate synthase
MPPAESPPSDDAGADAKRLAQAMQDLAVRGQRLIESFLERQSEDEGFQIPDPAVIAKAFIELGHRLLEDPSRLAEAQAKLWRDHAQLWQAAARRLQGEATTPVAEPARDDRRFKDEAWNEDAVFDFIKQSYLLTAGWIQETVRNVKGLDVQTARKVDFYTRQFVDAWAPTNFVATNPKVLKATLESRGENLVRGMDRLLSDLERGKGRLRISMTDAGAFRLGENVATTPGKVVFENELMQLIQYAPSTDAVAKRPLLIVPPWINKYYVLDLQPKNSFVKWAVAQGQTVFVISWVNPDERLSHKTFDDYMLEGPLAALKAIERATGETSANIVGYCIGGTLTACALAYLAVKKDRRIASATFLTTMVDFADAGELAVFIDEEQLARLEAHMERKGYLDGEHMMTVFNMMRDNDLIWSFVVNNYLMGCDPIPFDLLYWNSDSTRMPAMMHGMYLRKMYLENKLIERGGIRLAGVPIDLRKVKVPVYLLSTREDHIAPWKSTYAATQIYKGPVKFVLSGSGHIAGVINPPAANKYCYWTQAKTPKDPEAWLAGAARREGSWWPDWMAWLKGFADGEVKARAPSRGRLKAIEAAPGRYVKTRLV